MRGTTAASLKQFMRILQLQATGPRIRRSLLPSTDLRNAVAGANLVNSAAKRNKESSVFAAPWLFACRRL